MQILASLKGSKSGADHDMYMRLYAFENGGLENVHIECFFHDFFPRKMKEAVELENTAAFFQV